MGRIPRIITGSATRAKRAHPPSRGMTRLKWPNRASQAVSRKIEKGNRRSTCASDVPGKPVSASRSEMIEVVLPNDANALGNMLGGRVMHFIDIAGALAAGRHSNSYVVTASVDYLDFRFPIAVGEFIVLKASVNRVFHTSMEVGVKVFAENILTGERKHTSSAYVTYVALDLNREPHPAPPLILETDEDRAPISRSGRAPRAPPGDSPQGNPAAKVAYFLGHRAIDCLGLGVCIAHDFEKIADGFGGLESLLDAFSERRSFEVVSRKKEPRIFPFAVANGFDDVAVAKIVLRQRFRMLPDRRGDRQPR